MYEIVALISLESELSKETMSKLVHDALSFVRSHTRDKISVCVNTYDIALILKSDYTSYIQIDAADPKKVLVPVIDVDSGAEELVEKKVLGNIEHILLTTCESRKHDFVRQDLTILLGKQNGVELLVNALEAEGLFYE